MKHVRENEQVYFVEYVPDFVHPLDLIEPIADDRVIDDGGITLPGIGVVDLAELAGKPNGKLYEQAVVYDTDHLGG
jgi:hypothetical protein